MKQMNKIIWIFIEKVINLKVRVHLPEDMTEIYKKMDEFKAKKTVRECTPQQIDAIIKYFKENKADSKVKN